MTLFLEFMSIEIKFAITLSLVPSVSLQGTFSFCILRLHKTSVPLSAILYDDNILKRASQVSKKSWFLHKFPIFVDPFFVSWLPPSSANRNSVLL